MGVIFHIFQSIMFSPCGAEHLSLCVKNFSFWRQSSRAFSLFWGIEMNSKACILRLGKVLSNGVPFELVCVSVCSGPRFLVWVHQGFGYVAIVPFETLQDGSLGLSHIQNQ